MCVYIYIWRAWNSKWVIQPKNVTVVCLKLMFRTQVKLSRCNHTAEHTHLSFLAKATWRYLWVINNTMRGSTTYNITRPGVSQVLPADSENSFRTVQWSNTKSLLMGKKLTHCTQTEISNSYFKRSWLKEAGLISASSTSSPPILSFLMFQGIHQFYLR